MKFIKKICTKYAGSLYKIHRKFVCMSFIQSLCEIHKKFVKFVRSIKKFIRNFYEFHKKIL